MKKQNLTIFRFQKSKYDSVNSLPNDILDLSKFKALEDDKINVTKKLKFVWGMVEKNLAKGENAGGQHFLLFQNVFKSLILQRH